MAEGRGVGAGVRATARGGRLAVKRIVMPMACRLTVGLLGRCLGGSRPAEARGSEEMRVTTSVPAMVRTIQATDDHEAAVRR